MPLHSPASRLLTALAIVIGLSAPAFAEPPVSLRDVLETVRRENPELMAAKVRVYAAAAVAHAAGALEAPRLSLGAMQLWGLEGPNVTLSQAVPLGDRLRLEAQRSHSEMEQADFEALARWRELAREAADAYVELGKVERALDLVQSNTVQIRTLQRVATARYAAGSGTQQEPLRAQATLIRQRDRTLELERQRTTLRLQLNRLRNTRLDTALVVETMPTVASASTPTVDDHPAVLAAVSGAAVAEARARAVRASTTWPDVEIGLQAGIAAPVPMNYVGAMVSLPLPWLAPLHREHMVVESAWGLREAEAAVESRRAQVGSRLAELDSDRSAAAARSGFLRGGLLIQDREAFRAALAAYQVGKADLSAPLEAQQGWFEDQMALLDSEAAAAKAAIALAIESGAYDAPATP